MTQYNSVMKHNRLSNNGMSLWVPTHLADVSIGAFPSDVDIYAQNAGQLFPLNTSLEFADGRLFRYGKWGATETAPLIARMVANANLVPGSAATNGYEGTLDSTSDYAVGSTTLIMNDTTDRAKNAYEDGMLAVYPSGHYVEYRILGNDVATSVDDVTIYLEDGLATALVVASTGITAYPSIYSNIQHAYSVGYETPVGICLATGFTSTYFGWVQRRGRCIITPTAYFGDSANERLAMYWQDGTIATAASADPSSGYMIVGYLSQLTVSGYGDLEVYLHLE